MEFISILKLNPYEIGRAFSPFHNDLCALLEYIMNHNHTYREQESERACTSEIEKERDREREREIDR